MKSTARRTAWPWLLYAVTVAAGCSDAAVPSMPAPLTEGVAPQGFPSGPVTATAPTDNALTERRAHLGKRLFHDPILSRTSTISCATCHRQEHAFAEARATSVGVDGREGARNAPTLVNLAWSTSLFWDGRARTLEEQVGQPIENPLEMDLPLPDAVERLRARDIDVREFANAYGGAPSSESVRNALASFVRTLVSGGSPYDRFLAGDRAALSDDELRGESLFFSEATGCFHCHPPGSLTNDGFFNNGSFVAGGDIGRQTVTKRAGDVGKFRVPGLRNVAVSGPYLHNGSLATLDEVVDQYERGGRGHPSTDPQVTPLALSRAEKADLVAFLKALTDQAFLTDARFRP